MRLPLAVYIVCGAALLNALAADSACPPLEVQQDFNAEEYVRASWYVQKQQVNGFQPMEALSCVATTYNETFRGQTKSSSSGFLAFNDCKVGGKNKEAQYNFEDVNFKQQFSNPLCVRVPDYNEPSKLTVAPCLFSDVFAGDYWVAAAGPSPDKYQWAIVTAGQPTIQMDDGCTTPTTCSGPARTGCGLWFFTRQPVPSVGVMEQLEEAARQKGLSFQNLVTINHQGCDYDGYAIKPDTVI